MTTISMTKPHQADFSASEAKTGTAEEHRTKLILGVGSGQALSMRTNNLKYHLMRDLL